MFSTIKLVSRHQNTQQFGALLPIELTNDAIKNSKAYKEYYAIATGEAVPKPKAVSGGPEGKQTAKASKAKSLSALFEVAMTEAQQLKLVTKRSMQQTHISQPSGSGADEGTGSIPGVPDVPTDESEEELSWNSTDDEGDDNEEQDDNGDEEDEGDDGEEGNSDDDDDEDDDGGDDEHESDEETMEEESFDPIPQTPEDSEDEGDERHDEEEEEDELYRDVNINQGRGIQATLAVEDSHVTLTLVYPDGQQESSSVSSQFVTSMLNPTLDVGMESIFETTSQLDVPTPTSVAPLPITTPTMTSSTIATTTTTSQAPILPTVPSNIIQHLPSFGSLFCFDDRLRSLKENFSEFRQTNQFAGAVSTIPGIVNHYMDQRMNEAVKVAVQIQSDRLRDETQRENDEFLRTVNDNIKKIIKEQVKEQVKAQVSKTLSRIEQALNEQLEAEVLTRSSHSSRTSYVVAADLSEMELKKILIEKMEGNKRRDDDADKDEEPSAGPDRGSKRRGEGKEPESASAPTETAIRRAARSTQGSRSRQASASESALAEEPMQTTSQMEEPSHPEFDTELLAGPTYELMKGSCKSLIELEYHLEEVYKATTDQLDWVNPEGQQQINWIEDLVLRTMWINEPIGYDKHALWGVSYWGRKRQQFYGFVINREFARDVYSKRRITAVTELKIVKWHSYKHLDMITVQRDDDKLYKFKEGDFKRLRIQYIEDMLLLIVQGKLTNLTVEERFAFNVSLRMFTRSIVI
nr:hypothetical protein [Tanacetum cinerariifolium]